MLRFQAIPVSPPQPYLRYGKSEHKPRGVLASIPKEQFYFYYSEKEQFYFYYSEKEQFYFYDSEKE